MDENMLNISLLILLHMLPTNKRVDINCCVWKLMALPVSPEEDILPAFERISATIHVCTLSYIL